MIKKPKKSQALIDAEAAVIAKKEEHRVMNEGLMRLNDEVNESLAKLRVARIDADAALPQCKVVLGSTTRRMVIVGRAAHGMLRIRDLGDHGGFERKFKYHNLSMTFRSYYGQRGGFGRETLTDVPEEFIPKKPVIEVKMDED